MSARHPGPQATSDLSPGDRAGGSQNAGRSQPTQRVRGRPVALRRGSHPHAHVFDRLRDHEAAVVALDRSAELFEILSELNGPFRAVRRPDARPDARGVVAD